MRLGVYLRMRPTTMPDVVAGAGPEGCGRYGLPTLSFIVMSHSTASKADVSRVSHRRSVFLHYTLQWMLVLACELKNLIHLGGGNVTGVDPANSAPFGMDFEHHTRCLFTTQMEKLLKNDDYELHRRVIVIQQNHLVHRRRFQLLLVG